MIGKSEILNCLVKSADEARQLYIRKKVERFDGCPTPLEFYRNWVSKNVPCIFTNTFNHWDALSKWNNKYLSDMMKDEDITIAVTPDGYADSVVDGCFMLPEERRMTMSDFIQKLEAKEESVYYAQKQNSSLKDEFKDLLKDVDEEIKWASTAFNTSPDAVNFWMGDKRAVTSLHKDFFENLYCVIKGKKIFTLIPPSDRPFIYYEKFPVANHKFAGGKWTIEHHHESEKVPWIPIDPLKPDLVKYPNFVHANPLQVTVNEGEMLFLPSMWFHHVQQTDNTIAINYWYDMQFDVKYNYYHTLNEITECLNKNQI